MSFFVNKLACILGIAVCMHLHMYQVMSRPILNLPPSASLATMLPSFRPSSPPSTTRVLYQRRPSADSVSIQSFTTAVSFSVASPKGTNGTVEGLLTTLSNQDDVAWVALDEPLHVHTITADFVVPDDPLFDQQWGLEAIRAPEAWVVATSAPSRDDAITICVVDSGVDYLHADLRDNIAPAIGISVLSGEDSPMDDLYHGTHVAGIVGAVGSNDLQVSGVVWGNTSVLACRFIDSTGYGTTSGAVECVSYCLSQGARVIQASWGGVGLPNSAMEAAVAAAAAADALMVVSAGNDALDVDDTPQYPTTYSLDHPNLLAVASVGATGALSSFSNYGAASVQLAAPGEGILSTLPGNATGSYSGTSMAAPFVSGAAALVLSVAGRDALNATELRNLLMDTAELTPTLQGKVAAGMLRLDAALERAAGLAAA